MILWWILGGVALILVALIVFVALQPPTFRVARSAEIARMPAAVYELVADFRKWHDWSPWAKLDPNMKLDYDGPPSGTGAKYHWDANKQVGEGRMTIVDSRPGEFVKILLEFLRPFVATNDTLFTFRPVGGDKTQVTWEMIGKKNLLFKAMLLFASMDKMVGGDFEKGLANMKLLAETQAKAGIR